MNYIEYIISLKEMLKKCDYTLMVDFVSMNRELFPPGIEKNFINATETSKKLTYIKLATMEKECKDYINQLLEEEDVKKHITKLYFDNVDLTDDYETIKKWYLESSS